MQYNGETHKMQQVLMPRKRKKCYKNTKFNFDINDFYLLSLNQFS